MVDRGKIVESGPHAELLAQRGLYANLYTEQFDSGRIEAHCEDGVVFSDGSIATAEKSEPALAGASSQREPARSGGRGNSRRRDDGMPWEEEEI